MRSVTFAVFFVVFHGLISSGCSKKDEPVIAPPKDPHPHAAPHGGDIVELAGGTIHLEFLHSESAGTVVVHVLDGAMKPINVTDAPVVNLKTASGPRQLTGVAAAQGASGASEWSFRDDALKGHPEDASLRISIAGKSYSPDLPHAHH